MSFLVRSSKLTAQTIRSTTTNNLRQKQTFFRAFKSTAVNMGVHNLARYVRLHCAIGKDTNIMQQVRIRSSSQGQQGRRSRRLCDLVRSLQGHCPSSCQVCLSSISLLPTLTSNEQKLTCFDRFSDEFPGAHFVKVDVDEVPDVAQELGIRAMPTFLIFKNGEKVEEIVGANPKALLAGIEKAVAA